MKIEGDVYGALMGVTVVAFALFLAWGTYYKYTMPEKYPIYCPPAQQELAKAFGIGGIHYERLDITCEFYAQ